MGGSFLGSRFHGKKDKNLAKATCNLEIVSLQNYVIKQYYKDEKYEFVHFHGKEIPSDRHSLIRRTEHLYCINF